MASQSIEKRIALSLFSIGLLLLAVLAVSRAVAAEENEAVAEAEPEDSRALVVFVDKPVPLVEGVEPQFPPVALVVEPANEVEDTAQLQSINQFNLSIQQHESDGGAWNSALFETLSGLGNLQQQLQNHTEALGTFDRAMQISRINNGLHTADQLPIVGEIIESHLAMGNWEQADIYYDYLFYIQHKAFG